VVVAGVAPEIHLLPVVEVRVPFMKRPNLLL
jgi:hypothetical protein